MATPYAALVTAATLARTRRVRHDDAMMQKRLAYVAGLIAQSSRDSASTSFTRVVGAKDAMEEDARG